MSEMIRILCVDDHDFLIDGLEARINLEPDMQCVGRLGSADRLGDRVAEIGPDIILLDIEMPGADSFEAVRDLKRRNDKARVVFLSAYVRDTYLSDAFKSGAYGYFSKSDASDDIIDGLRSVMRGQFALGPKVQERCRPIPDIEADDPSETTPSTLLELLTPREREVLRLIGRGYSRTRIAETLSRSPKTIDGHREKIMKKLEIHDRGELVRFAIREGLVEA